MKEPLSKEQLSEDTISAVFLNVFGDFPEPVSPTLFFLFSKYSTSFLIDYLFPSNVSESTKFYALLARDFIISLGFSFLSKLFISDANAFNLFLLAQASTQAGNVVSTLMF